MIITMKVKEEHIDAEKPPANSRRSLSERIATAERENAELKKVVVELLLRNRTLKTRVERYKAEIREISRGV